MRFIIELYIVLALLVAPVLSLKEMGLGPTEALVGGMLMFVGVCYSLQTHKKPSDEG